MNTSIHLGSWALVLAILFVLFTPNGLPTVYYVAPSGGSDSNSGAIGAPFATINKGISVMQPGDTLYMRGGTYHQLVRFPTGKQGTPDKWFTMSSYPGEWAIIDGQHNLNACLIEAFDMGPTACPKYWKFQHFEVTGGGSANGVCPGGGMSFWTGCHLVFEYLYVHDNYGGGSDNNAGLGIANNGQGAQYITIQYCYFKDNCDPNNINCANITFFADYVMQPASVVIANGRQGNIVRYNLLEGSHHGIKSKAAQYLTQDITGANMTYKDLGDQIHHNIIRYHRGEGVSARQDFIQVYNNIVTGENSRNGVYLGSTQCDPEREPFHGCVYNNTFIGVDTGIAYPERTVYTTAFNPYCRFYNNLLTSQKPEQDGANDLNLFCTYNSMTDSGIQFDKVFVEKNLFHSRTSTAEVIDVGYVSNDYSTSAFIAKGYSKVLYATTTDPFSGSSEQYVPNFTMKVGDAGTTLDKAGVGGAHPYLSGVTIPAYLGAANPTDHNWVNGVLSLATLSNLQKFNETTPSWVEGATPTQPENVPPPTNLRITNP